MTSDAEPDAAPPPPAPTVKAPVGRGRRRDPTIDDRVARSVIEIYAEQGWAGLTFDEVARRARVGKAALYLRWMTKEDLLLDSMATVRVRRPPTGHAEIRRDLTSMALALLDFYSNPRGLAYLRMYVESRQVPGLEARWRAEYTTPMFLETRTLVRDAIARGELPAHASPTIVLDALTGAITNHVLSTPQDRVPEMLARAPAYVDALVELVLTGARGPSTSVPR